jgi:UDP-N-acetylglucosamine 2-epimerase (non-hydrolysing)
MREVLEHYRPGIESSEVLGELDLQPGGYFVVSSHREENVDDPARLADLLAVIDSLVARYGKPVVVSTHPRTRRRLDEGGFSTERGALVSFLRPLGLLDYVKLQCHAACVLSDSGTITEESAILGFPAVTLRESHERPEGMDEGVLVMCGLAPDRVLEAVDVVMRQAGSRPTPRAVADYEAFDVSRKVVRVVLSYTDVINRTVWFKKR